MVKDKPIQIGDTVINTESGVIGKVIKQYYPTSCAEQTMVITTDGRKYHAPTSTWKHFDGDCNYAAPCTVSAGMMAAAPVMVKHDYWDIKIDANTTITIDLEDLKEQMKRDFYKSAGLPGLNFGA